jgi:hypothetical protein
LSIVQVRDPAPRDAENRFLAPLRRTLRHVGGVSR